jgi:hypothetical protein
VLKQADFWDSVNLQEGGKYEPASKIAALSDLLAQVRDPGEGSRDRDLGRGI